MAILRHYVVVLSIAIISFIPNVCLAAKMNAIDQCWKLNPNWQRSRQQLATCSVGFAGKMSNNVGKGIIWYKVTDPSDHPVNPRKGTLRYGATMITGKVWITFAKNMNIKLQKPLFISSNTAIDGRGVDVSIEGVGCLVVYQATDVIIHGLNIHHCNSVGPSSVMGPDGKLMPIGLMDGDAIRLVSASKVWIDHNTLHSCQDGLLDVTRGSTFVTVSNNWFRNQDKVMLLGHDDGFSMDKNMKVTVAFNYFGPNCNQRMPRVRYGYAHVANNYYLGWEQYAIGGSMNPTIKSESNKFVPPNSGKEITWRNEVDVKKTVSWNFYSVGDLLKNGASFKQTGRQGMAKPNYNKEQSFKVEAASLVRALTSSAGALKCSRTLAC